MEKDKHGGGLPPSGRFSGISSTGNLFNIKAEPPQATAFGQGMSLDVNRFSHDLSRMPDNPPRNMGHRRAHSEILTLPDDISFDSDLGVVGGADGPSFSDDIDTDDFLSAYLDMGKVNSSSATSAFQVGEPFSGAAGAQTGVPPSASPATAAVENARGESSERLRIRHQHSQSMDWSTMIKPETLVSGSEDTYGADSKKAVSAAKLAELSLIDPKRAKRIWANRQSAARSKERKMRYIAELERKVQTLQTEATSLSAQLTILQRDTNSLAAENSELKLRLQSMEQQVHLQDALNDTLKEEIHHLKILTGQTNPNGGPMMKFPASSYRGSQPLYPSNQAMQTLLTAQQLQQLQIHSQNPQHQLHQLQQHAQQEQRQQQQQRQLTEDLKISGGSMLAPSQKENASDLRTPVSKD